MTEEETQAWSKFTSFAIAQLEHFIDRQNFIGIGIDPSFYAKERLFVSKVVNKYQWTYKTWDSITDYHKVTSSQEERLKLKFGKQNPTVHSIQGELSLDFYNNTVKSLEQLTLKPFVKMDKAGLDGTTQTIFIGDHYRESRFSWWSYIPVEWEALNPILSDLYKNLEIARVKLSEKLIMV